MMTLMRVAFICISVFCFVHILRDVLQIKYGYKHWFLRVGHVWHSPEHEIHGIIVCAILGGIFLYLGLR